MSGEDVQVTFGAQVEDFLSGMNRVRFAIEGLTNPQRILDQANKVYEKSLNDVFGEVQTAFNSQLRGLLAGTTSWAQAGRAIIGDFIIWAIEQFEKMAFEWVAHELVKTAATETGVAARTAAEQAGAAASLVTMFANILKSIAASVGQVFAGVTAFLAPTMGPGAPAAGAGVAAAVGATAAAMVPSSAIGGLVLSDGLVSLHEGNVVTPATMSQPFDSSMLGNGKGGGSAPVSVSVSVNALDAGSVQSWLKRGGALQIARAISGTQVLNPSLSTG